MQISQGFEYEFDAVVTDNKHRFNLHFGNLNDVEEHMENNVCIYSFDSRIYISSKDIVNGTVSVYDLSGKTMLHEKVSGNNFYSIPANVSTGLYIVKLYGEDKTVSQKIYIK
jgi:hypothetical protein